MGMFRCVLIAQGCPRRVEASSSRGGCPRHAGGGCPRHAGGVLVTRGVSSSCRVFAWGCFLLCGGDVAGFGVVSWVGERRDGMEGTYPDDDDDYLSSSAFVAPCCW
jgi:hypothetical protein